MSRTPTPYQTFIQNRLHQLREEHPNLRNVEYMQMAAREWTASKNNPQSATQNKKLNSQPEPKPETEQDKIEYQKFVDDRMAQICLERPNLRTKDYQNLIRQEWLDAKK